jgi:hypothetical protein
VSIAAAVWAVAVRPGDGKLVERGADGVKRELRVPEVSRKVVLLVLAVHANKAGKAWPSLETIAAESCLSRRSAQRAVASLVEDGWVGRLRRRNRSSVYVLAVGRRGFEP